MHTYIHIHTHMHTHTRAHIYLSINTYTYTHTYKYIVHEENAYIRSAPCKRMISLILFSVKAYNENFFKPD